jgi:O-antigen biosynthesis protein WbqP
MKRVFDLTLSVLLSLLLLPAICVIAVVIKLTSKGPVLYWSERVGRHNRLFPMPKFRTMRIDTPEVATHLLTDSDVWITPVGRLLRSTSLDELPQLYSILTGQMSFVGPRPALFNQHDLINQRRERGVDRLLPGLTGWAQINGRDELSLPDKVEADAYYLQNRSLLFDVKILCLTFVKVFRREGIVQADENSSASESSARRRDAA